MKARALLFGILLGLAGCASAPLASFQVDAGTPQMIPPLPCPYSVDLYDDTGDGTEDRFVITLEDGCNRAYEANPPVPEPKDPSRRSL